MELDEHLFRQESGRMVVALTRVFGVHNLALAEDVVQDAFCRALETWKVHGIPKEPSAWLMTTAKNRAIDLLRREQTASTFAPEISRILDENTLVGPVVELAFNDDVIRDEQLRMMFSCCDPKLAEEAQVALILNILCGFGASEIAGAFLTGTAGIEKRISRGKKTLAESDTLFDLEADQFVPRLTVVRRALYLLFNEGYHGASSDRVVRVELCREAMRLTWLLLDYRPAATPVTFALAALMHLHAARLPARIDEAGDLNSLIDQDRSSWDYRLVADGLALLERSAAGAEVTAYHVEAAIAATHASAKSVAETDWRGIVDLYDVLMGIAQSPVVALNRAIAIAQYAGPEQGIDAIYAITDCDRLAKYPFYEATLGELEHRRGNAAAAREHFVAALAVARNATERRFIEKRLKSEPTENG
jgi:RNA polymerase sigma-70 factor (ECF subfamily)